MNKVNEVSEIMNVLGVYESSPSAHCLVKSFSTVLTDSDIDKIYESSEGYNDQQTEQLLKSYTSDKLTEVKNILKEIAQEVKNSGDYEDDLHGCVEDIISKW